jgi:hypothetical protein
VSDGRVLPTVFWPDIRPGESARDLVVLIAGTGAWFIPGQAPVRANPPEGEAAHMECRRAAVSLSTVVERQARTRRQRRLAAAGAVAERLDVVVDRDGPERVRLRGRGRSVLVIRIIVRSSGASSPS